MKQFSAIAILSTLFLSCSAGTDPGDCQVAECLRAVYAVGIIESISSSDSLSPTYSIYTIIEHDDGVYSGENTIDHLIEFNGRKDSFAVGESFAVTLNDWRDTFSVAPSGSYNYWKIAVGGEPLVCDSIQTAVDPLRISSPGNKDLFNPAEDILVTIAGNFNHTTSATVSLVLVLDTETDFEVVELGDIPVTSSQVVIPASLYRDYSKENFRLTITLNQFYVESVQNAFGDPVQLSYIRKYKRYLLSQP